MATYFGYVEREADSYVNWADVGRNMSATIDNIQRVRDEKKTLIEKAYREDLDFIQANPTGENKSLREKSIEFANSAAENLKLKYNMLKQGKSSVKDFTSFRQNITDDTENLYGTLNKMQEEYKRKMDRAKAGDSQYLERRNMELLEQYDMSKTDLFVNGLTGAVTIGLMEEVEENGQKVRRLTKDPNKFISVNQYKAAVTEDYNNYDPLPALAGWVEQHGEVIESLRTLGSELQAGSILDVTDITGGVLKQKMEALGKTSEEIAVAQKAIDDWTAAKNAFYKSELANGYNFLAILTDQKKVAPNGKQYIPTYNIDDLKKGEEYIYIERNNVGGSVPTFEKHHEDDALEYLDLLTRPLLDKKVKMSTYTEVGRQKQEPRSANAAEIEAGGRAKTAEAMGTYIKDLWTGDMATKQVTLRTIKGEPGVDPRQTYFYTGSDGSIYLHVTKSTKADPTQPSVNIRMTQSDGVTPYGNIIDFGRNAASWIYGDDINRKILSQNLPQFDNVLNANPTFTPFNTKLKEDELWDVKYEAPAEELLEEFKKETFDDSTLYYNTGNIKGAEILNITLDKYGIKAVPKGWYGIDIKDEDGNVLKSISVDKDKGDRENYFKLLKDAVEKHLRKPQPQQPQTPKPTPAPK
jgi:hypothetical protein